MSQASVSPRQIDFTDSFRYSSPVKTLFHLYRGNRYRLVLSTIFYIIKHSPAWVLPIVSANIINIVSQPAQHTLKEVWVNVIIILVMIIQNIYTNALHIRFLSEACRSVESRLRGSLIRKLQQLSFTFHSEHQSGKLQAKVLRDVEAIENLSRQLVAQLVPSILAVVVALSYTLNKNPWLSLFYVLTIPVACLLIYSFRNSMHSKNREFRKEIETMAARISESIEMIPVTRAHGLETVEIAKIDSHLAKVQSQGLRLDVLNAIFGASAWVSFQFFQVACLVMTAYMAYRGQIPVGDIVMYQGFFNTITMSVSSLINIYPQLAKGLESIHSIGEVLECADDEHNVGKQPVAEVRGSFDFQSVGFAYPSGKAAAIQDFNLTVSPGECIALVGESGAGKSTILNLLIGFYRPTRGRILLDGIDMAELDLRDYRRFLAVVPQSTILFSGTIRENITYGLQAIDDDRLQQALEMASAREFIDKLPDGLDTRIGEHGGKLSGGQRQRIAIARALVRDPRIIILDEPTSALDLISEAQVKQAISTLIKRRTTFIVAHRLSTIRDADRIVVIKDGAIAEIGTYDALTARDGEFHKLEILYNRAN